MKTIKSDKWPVASDRRSVAGDQMENAARSHHVSRFTFHASTLNPQPSTGFTLIELLVVIGIMALLAALLLPVAAAVKKRQYLNHAQAEMVSLETAIDRYKAAYGFYPPGPPIPPALNNAQSYVNQLYYELVGTTNNYGVYQTLDGSSQINAGDLPYKAFPGSGGLPGVGGFMNCSRGGEDASVAKNFLPDLRPNQIWPGYSNNAVPVYLLITAVGGPDTTYQPMNMQDLNPWRYVCPGTNNPGSYDLWVQLRISGKTNLICNWSQQVRTDSPLP
jgi:prepilin-type N-terminal cleavage/methylation domain-containing protein